MSPSRPSETDLSGRVARIEAGLEALMGDVAQFVTTTSASVKQLGEQFADANRETNEALRRFASETNAIINSITLRQEESRRTPWSTLAAWAGVTLMVGGVFGGIIRSDITENRGRIEKLEDAHVAHEIEAARDSGRRDEQQRWMEREVERLRLGGKAP